MSEQREIPTKATRNHSARILAVLLPVSAEYHRLRHLGGYRREMPTTPLENDEKALPAIMYVERQRGGGFRRITARCV